jgi:hypothetical protein
MTRQRRWAIRMRQENRCIVCGHPVQRYKARCDEHQTQVRLANRRRYQWKRVFGTGRTVFDVVAGQADGQNASLASQ